MGEGDGRLRPSREPSKALFKMPYCFLATEEDVTGFGWLTENCDGLPAGFAFDCFGFFFSRLLLS